MKQPPLTSKLNNRTEENSTEQFDPYNTSSNLKKEESYRQRHASKKSVELIDEKDRMVAIPAVDYKFRTKIPTNCHISKTI